MACTHADAMTLDSGHKLVNKIGIEPPMPKETGSSRKDASQGIFWNHKPSQNVRRLRSQNYLADSSDCTDCIRVLLRMLEVVAHGLSGHFCSSSRSTGQCPRFLCYRYSRCTRATHSKFRRRPTWTMILAVTVKTS